MQRRSILRATGAAAAMLAMPTLRAQQWPYGPVRIIVGFPPGGGTDALARVVGQKLTVMWGQPVVVENKAGVAGVLAADYVRQFDRRWVRSPAHDDRELLGAADIQSLADLENGFSVIKSITALPVSRDTFIRLILATVIPFAPLLLTMFPLEELLNRIIGGVF